jgi:hypothetical protein
MTDIAADPGAVRARAYELWEQDGQPEGRELDYWLMAEAELTRGAGIAGGPPVLDEMAPAAPPPGNEPGEDMTAPDVPARQERAAR